MPAMSYTDIPNDAKLQIRFLPNRTPKEVWVEAVDHDGNLYHRDGAERSLMGIKAEVLVDPHSGRGLWRVTNSFAEKGFGPLVYDIMMELASLEDRIGLATGTGLTQDSTNVWKYYLEHRNDVIRLSEHNEFVMSVLDKGFPFVWRKDNNILAVLEAAGKIEWIEGDADILATLEQSDSEEDEQLNRLLEELDGDDAAE